MDDATLAQLGVLLAGMRDAASEAERVQRDADFHALVAASCGNSTLTSMLTAVSSRTVRARAWRGVIDENAKAKTLTQHEDILAALADRDPGRAEAAALLHVATTEAWLRRVIELAAPDDAPIEPRRGRHGRSSEGTAGGRTT